MKKSHFIPAFLLSAALLSGLAGCKKETEYYNPNAQTSSVTETQTELQTEPSTQASTEESTEACSLYPPDRGTKRCRSNRGIPDPQSGVRILCPRRLGDIRSETKYPRNSRMHSDVQRHHPRPTARKAGK